MQCWMLCASKSKRRLTQKIDTGEEDSLLWLYLTVWFWSLWNWLLGRIWKELEICTTESFDCCVGARWIFLGAHQKTRMLARMWMVKARLRRFQLGIKVPWVVELGTMSIILWKKIGTFCPCLEVLWETGIKGGGLIGLVEGNSKAAQPSGCGKVLTAFIQIYSETLEQKSEKKNLKSLHFVPEGAMYKVGAKRDVVGEGISTIKKKPSALYSKKKDALRESQKSVRPQPLQV